MNKLTTHGITLPELRAITATPEHQAKIREAEQYQPDTHEQHRAAQLLYRDLMRGQRVNNGESATPNLADVLHTADGYKALFDYFQHKVTREEVTDMVMKWCLNQATAVIRDGMIQEIESRAIEAYQDREDAA